MFFLDADNFACPKGLSVLLLLEPFTSWTTVMLSGKTSGYISDNGSSVPDWAAYHNSKPTGYWMLGHYHFLDSTSNKSQEETELLKWGCSGHTLIYTKELTL